MVLQHEMTNTGLNQHLKLGAVGLQYFRVCYAITTVSGGVGYGIHPSHTEAVVAHYSGLERTSLETGV